MVNYDFSQSFILASVGRAVLPGADLTTPVTQALGSTGSGSVTSSLWQGTAGQRTSDRQQDVWKFSESGGQEGPCPWLPGSDWPNNVPLFLHEYHKMWGSW